jgi:type VI secretion system secreted protein Hcp
MKRSNSRGFLIAVMVAAVLLTSSSAMAAVDMFLKMTGITGESVDASHPNEIDVLAWSWGTSTGTGKTGKGAVPAACIQDLNLTKYIDLASPQIIMNGVTGVVVPEAILTMRRAGGTPIEFLILKMTNVSVAAYSTGGSGGEDRLTENVTLHFESMRGEYRRQNANGIPGTPVVFEVVGGGCK